MMPRAVWTGSRPWPAMSPMGGKVTGAMVAAAGVACSTVVAGPAEQQVADGGDQLGG